MLLTCDEHCIGRLVDDTHFQITAPAVNANHCKIYRKKVSAADTKLPSDNCSVFLKDSSTNGTYLNWEKLNKNGSEMKLCHGDIISIAAAPHHEYAYAFVFREIQKSSVVNGLLKRKAEELGTENKRLKGIGIGALDGPISLDDFRSLEKSNKELRKLLEDQVAINGALHSENRASTEKHDSEMRGLQESISKSYRSEFNMLNQHLEAKKKELAELNRTFAEQRHEMENFNKRLIASKQSCVEANEIIVSQKASMSELKTLLDEERDQRRREREKAIADLNLSVLRIRAETAEEIKRVSDGALMREKEQLERINKLQDAEKERCSLVETLRSKLEDTRKKLVNSDNKVRQLEGQIHEELLASAWSRKRVEEIEHDRKRLIKELDCEKAAREEAREKVSALELEISVALRDLDFERCRLKGARERIMLRETQLRSFYSTTEEISVLFVKQQEQLKAMQRTLEDEQRNQAEMTQLHSEPIADLQVPTDVLSSSTAAQPSTSVQNPGHEAVEEIAAELDQTETESPHLAMVIFSEEDKGKAPETSEFSSPEIPVAIGIMLEEIQSSLHNLISTVSDIKSTQIMHTLKIDSMNENTMKNLNQVTKDITSLFLLVDQLNKDIVTVPALFQTQDAFIKRIDFLETTMIKRMDLMQEQMMNAISQVSSEVRLLLSLVGVDKKGEEEQQQQQSKKRPSQPTDQRPTEKITKK